MCIRDSYYGGTVAGPVMQELLRNILPYLGMEAKYDEKEAEEAAELKTIVPDLLGMTLNEGKNALFQAGLSARLETEGETITGQMPPAGESAVSYTHLIIKKAVPKGARKDGPHPAKRTFQAIRIEVNGELEVLQRAIDDVAARLAVGGRLCIITFHSLEDRIVKEAFRKQENPCICPPQFPVCVCGKKPCLLYTSRCV